MINTALIPWLDPETIIAGAGPWALVVVCFIVFAETGLLVGFLLPGDTLLVISGLLSHSTPAAPNGVFGVSVWIVALLIGLAAFVGGEVGYEIGHRGGPKVFERKESGLFSVKNVERTNAFFERFGGLTIILARFVPIVRTFAPVAAGVGHMKRARYSLYNFTGAVLWGFGLTMFGYLIGFIPWISDLVTKYIDVILLIAVGGTALVTGWHYLNERRKARKAAAAGEDVEVDAVEAEALVLDAEMFETRREHHHGVGRHVQGGHPTPAHPAEDETDRGAAPRA
jgi:membrane-associated protein